MMASSSSACEALKRDIRPSVAAERSVVGFVGWKRRVVRVSLWESE